MIAEFAISESASHGMEFCENFVFPTEMDLSRGSVKGLCYSFQIVVLFGVYANMSPFYYVNHR